MYSDSVWTPYSVVRTPADPEAGARLPAQAAPCLGASFEEFRFGVAGSVPDVKALAALMFISLSP
jgi:hypothetical protein